MLLGAPCKLNCAQNVTPRSIQLVRTISKSAQQLFGLDKTRLARAEILAIQRELRTSRANNSEMARVVQVSFACCGPVPCLKGFWSADFCMCSSDVVAQETRADGGSSSLLGVC